MLKRFIAWVVVFCLLTALSSAAQAEDHFAWTVEELSERVSLEDCDDGLPVYIPKAPVEGVALYVHDLRADKKDAPHRSRDMRNLILNVMAGSLQFTDDPDQASMLLLYEEWYGLAGHYHGASGWISAYSCTARLCLVSLTDESVQPVRSSYQNSPGQSITVSQTDVAWYAPMPDLCKRDRITEVITVLLAICQSDRNVVIGLRSITLDTKDLSIIINDANELAKLSKLIQLEELSLSLKISGENVDVSPLSSLTLLQKLHLSSVGNITDVSPLSELHQLVELNLGATFCKDVSPLSELNQLITLSLSSNRMIDISPLSKLNQLVNLNLYNNRIADVSSLSKLNQLVTLDLSSNEITDVSPLSELINLKSLGLSSNEITDVSPLSELINLKSLGLSRNEILDVSPLSELINLTSLYLFRNKIADFSSLIQLTELQELSLSENKITEIPPLANLHNLTSLYLADNEIADISALADCDLIVLDLSNNQLTDISSLSENSNLRDLTLNGNQITDFSPLYILSKLRKLKIDSSIHNEELEMLQQELPDCDIKLMD